MTSEGIERLLTELQKLDAAAAPCEATAQGILGTIETKQIVPKVSTGEYVVMHRGNLRQIIAALHRNQAEQADQPKATDRTCTCLGTCKGKEGLAPGWQCALETQLQPYEAAVRKSQAEQAAAGFEEWWAKHSDAHANVAWMRSGAAKVIAEMFWQAATQAAEAREAAKLERLRDEPLLNNPSRWVGKDNSDPPQWWVWEGDRDESAEPIRRLTPEEINNLHRLAAEFPGCPNCEQAAARVAAMWDACQTAHSVLSGIQGDYAAGSRVHQAYTKLSQLGCGPGENREPVFVDQTAARVAEFRRRAAEFREDEEQIHNLPYSAPDLFRDGHKSAVDGLLEMFNQIFAAERPGEE